MIALVVDSVTTEGAADRVGALLEQARLIVATVNTGTALEVDRRRVQHTHDTLFAT